jgi:predicted  nucleic acid-binding Zn-ribbon protein
MHTDCVYLTTVQAALRGEVAALKAEVGDAAASRKECRLLQERADDSERRLKGLQAELEAAQQARATAVQEAGRLAGNISAYEEHLQVCVVR